MTFVKQIILLFVFLVIINSSLIKNKSKRGWDKFNWFHSLPDKVQAPLGWVQILSVGNFCLTSAGHNNRLRQNDCDSKREDQLWQFHHNGNNVFEVINRKDLILSNKGAVTSNGNPIISEKSKLSSKNLNELWTVRKNENAYLIRSYSAHKCLDNTGSKHAGALYHLWDCNDGYTNANQLFMINVIHPSDYFQKIAAKKKADAVAKALEEKKKADEELKKKNEELAIAKSAEKEKLKKEKEEAEKKLQEKKEKLAKEKEAKKEADKKFKEAEEIRKKEEAQKKKEEEKLAKRVEERKDIGAGSSDQHMERNQGSKKRRRF